LGEVKNREEKNEQQCAGDESIVVEAVHGEEEDQPCEGQRQKLHHSGHLASIHWPSAALAPHFSSLNLITTYIYIHISQRGNMLTLANLTNVGLWHRAIQSVSLHRIVHVTGL
jgi:hypothetical protein